MFKVPKNRFKALNPLKSANGFTLIEAMLSVALLGLVAVGISAPYISGFQALDVQADRMLLDSSLRNRMETLVSTEFSSLGNGSEVVTVRGQTYNITWTAVNVDLDGDLSPEPNAWQITTSINELSDRSLTVIVVDHEGSVNKIS
jgi:prepilin-type N-terminal cleavage/methylation domain-containing protein